MTSDPKAPGADAVYLYREEKTDDNLHYHSYYVRIKVLTEKGKELATVRTPYERRSFKVTDIQGRTIHRDGTVIPLTAKPSDLTDVKTKNIQVNSMVFTLPNVDVGSILEYRLQIRYEDNTVSSPTWGIQQKYFVHKAHYSFEPTRDLDGITNSRGDLANHLMYALIVGNDVKMKHEMTGLTPSTSLTSRHPDRRLDAATEYDQLAGRVLLLPLHERHRILAERGQAVGKGDGSVRRPRQNTEECRCESSSAPVIPRSKRRGSFITQ